MSATTTDRRPTEPTSRPGVAAVAAVQRRVLRRETHGSRSGAVIVTMSIVLVVCIALVLVAGAVLIGQAVLGVDPRSVADAIGRAPSGVLPWALAAGGAVAVVIGLLLFFLGLLPHRRARHVVRSERLAVVVDDEVVASAFARAARSRTRLDPDAAVATVGRSSADVVLRPPAGLDVPADHAAAAVEDEASSIDLSPAVRTRVRVEPTGRVDG